MTSRQSEKSLQMILSYVGLLIFCMFLPVPLVLKITLLKVALPFIGIAVLVRFVAGKL